MDEVGRGPLAGPVVAGAVILPDLRGSRARGLGLIQDSKSLTERQRERADEVVRKVALAIGIGVATSAQVDEMGIMPATKLAMRLALDAPATVAASR